MNNTILKNYANLFVRAGGNVQKGQTVVIYSNIDAAYFARMVEECAYDAGASEVVMFWRDEVSTRTKYLRGADEIFSEYPDWMVERFKYYDDKGAVYLTILSDDPDLLNGVDPNRLKNFSKAASEKTKDHSALTMSYKVRWSLCAIPSPSWAKKMFPALPENEAIDRLWELILKAVRADGDDPIGEWQRHRESFVERVNYLNEQQFHALRITTGLGTDLTIGMPKNQVWKGGGGLCANEIPFFPNIPTEEVFSAPDRNRADGRVVASMPLSYQGNLITDIDLTFKDGVVIKHSASQNQEILDNIIKADDDAKDTATTFEGSRRLGEVAFVANSSPISQMQTLFYNTLYDENASCHLALGKAYPANIKGGTELSREELIAQGVNDSLIHVDFMVGTSDICIIGIYEDGREVVVMDDGEYVQMPNS